LTVILLGFDNMPFSASSAGWAADHLIRRSGQVVQDRPSPVVGWAGIPELSMCVERRLLRITGFSPDSITEIPHL
jgi:hypothetical protein